MKREDAVRLADRLEGTQDSIQLALESLELEDVDVCEAEDWMGSLNLERCPECDVWMEAGELVDEQGRVVPCSSCQPRERDDD